VGDLARIRAKQRRGTEPFRNGSEHLPFSIQDFWCWSTSNLVDNTTRGVLAEFLVSRALGSQTLDVRDPWSAFDLLTTDGIRIEVKSAAYLQSWTQERLCTIRFSAPQTQAWDAETGTYGVERVRHANVYVFALLAHLDKATVDPLDVSQWHFFVVAAKPLDERLGTRRSISLRDVKALAGRHVAFDEVASTVKNAYTRNSDAA
jgi:hypothetical protein